MTTNLSDITKGTRFQRRLLHTDTKEVMPFGAIWEVDEVYDSHIVLTSHYDGRNMFWNIVTPMFDDTIHRAGYVVVTDDKVAANTDQEVPV